MKFTAAFFALIPLVYAIPAPDPELPSISSRTQGAVFVCVNAGFTAPCAKFSGASGQCVNFPDAFNNDISSVGPDSGQDCFFFVGTGCSGATLGPIRDPGIADLAEPELPTTTSALGSSPTSTNFNDQISSFKCFFG
ncbi:hypothetical protein C8R44DRAFT_879133 [Mycena epipterygia]|nr:hypothetical protein C8R44DRAFT_879133 [Mycena epipterygia]